MSSWRAPLVKCILQLCRRTTEFWRIFWEIWFLSTSPSPILPLCSFLIPFHHPSPVCFHSPCATSIVRRLYPGQRRHHTVTWLSGLLPTQPQLHLDYRDLPWQRLAEKFCVNTCSSQIQFPLQCYFPLPSGLFILPNKLSLYDWSAQRLA